MMKCALSFKPQNEIVLHKNVRFDTKMTWGEKVFLAEVNSISSVSRCYYEQKALSELFHVAPVTIATWVKNLVNLGLLEIKVDLNDPKCKQILQPVNFVNL